MKLKLIFGVAIPLLVILCLAILGSTSEGFSIEKTFVKEISINDVFSDGNLKSNVKLGEVSLKNDYFLGRRYSLNSYSACLIDDGKLKGALNAGSVMYSEGDIDYSKGYDGAYLSSYAYGGGYNQAVSIQIGANKDKKVYMYLSPAYSYYSNYSELLDRYKDYDRLVLVENEDKKGYYSDTCYSLSDEKISSSVNIPLKLS